MTYKACTSQIRIEGSFEDRRNFLNEVQNEYEFHDLKSYNLDFDLAMKSNPTYCCKIFPRSVIAELDVYDEYDFVIKNLVDDRTLEKIIQTEKLTDVRFPNIGLSMKNDKYKLDEINEIWSSDAVYRFLNVNSTKITGFSFNNIVKDQCEFFNIGIVKSYEELWGVSSDVTEMICENETAAFSSIEFIIGQDKPPIKIIDILRSTYPNLKFKLSYVSHLNTAGEIGVYDDKMRKRKKVAEFREYQLSLLSDDLKKQYNKAKKIVDKEKVLSDNATKSIGDYVFDMYSNKKQK